MVDTLELELVLRVGEIRSLRSRRSPSIMEEGVEGRLLFPLGLRLRLHRL